jgi:acyl dehydratase
VRQEDISTFATLTGTSSGSTSIRNARRPARSAPRSSTASSPSGWRTGLLWEVCTVEGFGVVLNYRPEQGPFPGPRLRVGSRIRMRVQVAEVKAIDGPGGQGAEAVYRLTYDVDGQDKPCCVADLVFRYYP